MSSAFALLSDPIGNETASDDWQKPKKRPKRKAKAPSLAVTEVTNSDHQETKPPNEVRCISAPIIVCVVIKIAHA